MTLINRTLGWCVAGALALAGFTFNVAAQDRTSIRIGMSVSSTGNFALASQSGERGVRLWVEEANAAGGLTFGDAKYPIELVTRDDRSDKQLVTRVYEALIEEDKVDLLIAPFGSTLTGAAAAISERNEKFMASWSASSDGIFQLGYKSIISTTVPASQQPIQAMKALVTVGGKNVGLLYVDEPFPTTLAQSAKKAAEDVGLEVVFNEKHAKGTKDFGVILQKAKAAGVDLLYITSYEGDVISMIRQMKELDINFPAIFSQYSSTPQVLAIGSDAEFLWGLGLFDERANWTVTKGMDAKDFLAAYAKQFPNAAYGADFQTAIAYGMGVVLGEIVANTASLDADDLKKAALGLSGKITVINGPYAIDETGLQVGMTSLVTQNVGDKLELIGPKEVATAKPVYPAPGWSER